MTCHNNWYVLPEDKKTGRANCGQRSCLCMPDSDVWFDRVLDDVTCHIVTCHFLNVTCHLSNVTCHIQKVAPQSLKSAQSSAQEDGE